MLRCDPYDSSKIINEYGKVIVLEDDLVTSPYFLKFMNEALDFYEGEKKVWHISGWNYSIRLNYMKSVFLWGWMNCWGWGTWKDRWNNLITDVDLLMELVLKKDIKKFNLDGAEKAWQRLILNREKKLKTWAVFWNATIFVNNGLCVNPVESFVYNIGLDGSGTNCGKSYKCSYKYKLNNSKFFKFEDFLEENILIRKRIVLYLKKQKIKNMIMNVIKKVIN